MRLRGETAHHRASRIDAVLRLMLRALFVIAFVASGPGDQPDHQGAPLREAVPAELPADE